LDAWEDMSIKPATNVVGSLPQSTTDCT